jgi:hypothetical protein
MGLLGRRNWYLPHRLDWLPQLNVEATPAERDTQRVDQRNRQHVDL